MLDTEPEDLEDFDPYNSTHLSYEQLKQMGLPLREMRSEDMMDEIEETLKDGESILAILSSIQQRREQTKVIKVRF